MDFCSPFVREQLREGFLGADMVSFNPLQLLLRLHTGSDCHKTVEAAGIETAVFILGAVVHFSSELFRILNDIRRTPILLS